MASALESSATQFDHESVTASCCDAVSLSHTSVPKVSPVKLKVASPRPKRWPKHSTTTVIASPQGGGENDHELDVYLKPDPFSLLTAAGWGVILFPGSLCITAHDTESDPPWVWDLDGLGRGL